MSGRRGRSASRENGPNPSRRRRGEEPATPGLAARVAAADLLDSVLRRGEALDEGRMRTDLTPADRARARALTAETLRRLGQIDALLARHLDRNPGGLAEIALRLATAEIGFLGGAPHAAIDAAVTMVKRNRKTVRYGGLVNAVGRKLVEDAPGLAEIDARKAGRKNAPQWLFNMLLNAWGREAADAILAAHLVRPPLDLTPRDPAKADALARSLGGALTPTGSIRLPAGAQVSALPGYEEGAWWVQDAAAAIPARLLAPAPGMRVLDLCAAPGGKTLQLAAAGADVTALDISDARLERLRENLSRTGLNAEIVAADALDWRPDRPFDAILLDAPCSASGTIRRHPDLPYLRKGGEAKTLARLQDRLLSRAWDWLAPGGVLVFATCSLDPIEGEARAEAFLSQHDDANRTEISASELGGAAELLTPEGDLRARPDFWPEIGGMDGFFTARFRKRV